MTLFRRRSTTMMQCNHYVILARLLCGRYRPSTKVCGRPSARVRRESAAPSSASERASLCRLGGVGALPGPGGRGGVVPPQELQTHGQGLLRFLPNPTGCATLRYTYFVFASPLLSAATLGYWTETADCLLLENLGQSRHKGSTLFP